MDRFCLHIICASILLLVTAFALGTPGLKSDALRENTAVAGRYTMKKAVDYLGFSRRCPQGIGGVTEGVGYARDLWSEAPTLFNRGLASSNCSAVKGFCRNVVLTGMGFTALPDIMMMFICGCRLRAY